MFGFNPLQILCGVIGLAVVTAIGAYVWDCEREKEQFAVYKAEVKVLGEEAERKRVNEEIRRKRIDDEKEKSAIERVTDARARWLRNAGSSGGKAGGVSKPPKVCDDAASNKRLSDALDRFKTGTGRLLEQAEVQASQLIELQAWADEQSRVR